MSADDRTDGNGVGAPSASNATGEVGELAESLQTARLKDVSPLDSLIEQLKKDNLLRPLQDSYPLDVSRAPAFVDREEAVKTFLDEFADKVAAVAKGKTLDKSNARPVAVYGGSGFGKTVYLNEIINKGQVVQAQLEDQSMQTVTAMQEAVGVGVTFNSNSEIKHSERDAGFSLSESVAIRLFHAFFVQPTTRFMSPQYSQFVKDNKEVLTLESVVQTIVQKLDGAYLVLCIDEMMLAATGHEDPTTNQTAAKEAMKAFEDFFADLGPILNQVPRFFVVCSSLHISLLKQGATSSQRLLVMIDLPPIHTESVLKMYDHTIRRFTSETMRQNIKWVFSDIGGSPKLAYHFHKALEKALRVTAAAEWVLSYDNLLDLIDKTTMSKMLESIASHIQIFHNCVLLSLLAQPSSLADLNDGIYLGFIHTIQNGKEKDDSLATPLMPIALIRLFLKSVLSPASALNRSSEQDDVQLLLRLLGGPLENLLRFDNVDPQIYALAGTPYELQNMYLLSVRTRAQCLLTKSDTFNMSMWDFLTCGANSLQPYLTLGSPNLENLRPIIVGDYASFHAQLCWPKDWNVVTADFDKLQRLDRNTIYKARKSNEIAIDEIECLLDKDGKLFAFGIQDKSSDLSDHDQTLSKDDVLMAIVNLVKNYRTIFRAFIETGRFGLIFKIRRHVPKPNEGSWKAFLDSAVPAMVRAFDVTEDDEAFLPPEQLQVLCDARQKLSTRKITQTACNKIVEGVRKENIVRLALKVIDSTLIMDSDDIACYFGPMLMSRPQFAQVGR